MPDAPELPFVPSDTRPTVKLDPLDIVRAGDVSWPFAVAALERMGAWTVLALRLGTLALLQECVREMAMPNASAELVAKARELVESLARMPWEKP